jgi:hypothetical protein
MRRRSLLPSAREAAGLGGGPSRLTREVVLERDGFCCVACGLGGGLQPHHRIPVGRGGSSDLQVHAVVNLISVCPGCHDGLHRNPMLAGQVGLLVARDVDPVAVPVFTAAVGSCSSPAATPTAGGCPGPPRSRYDSICAGPPQ